MRAAVACSSCFLKHPEPGRSRRPLSPGSTLEPEHTAELPGVGCPSRREAGLDPSSAGRCHRRRWEVAEGDLALVPASTVLTRPGPRSWSCTRGPCPPVPRTLAVRTGLPVAPAHGLKWGWSPKGWGAKGGLVIRALGQEGVSPFTLRNVAPSANSTCVARGPSALFTCLAGRLSGC